LIFGWRLMKEGSWGTTVKHCGREKGGEGSMSSSSTSVHCIKACQQEKRVKCTFSLNEMEKRKETGPDAPATSRTGRTPNMFLTKNWVRERVKWKTNPNDTREANTIELDEGVPGVVVKRVFLGGWIDRTPLQHKNRSAVKCGILRIVARCIWGSLHRRESGVVKKTA